MVKIKLLISIIFVLILSCSEDPLTKEPLEEEIEITNLDGYVQKGPFISSTQILITDLDAELQQNGRIFTSQIKNDYGLFEFDNIKLSSSYVELSASGYYFDEILASISSAPLTLYALADLNNLNSVNINVLTSLERLRVRYLIQEEGLSFSEAKSKAQYDVLNNFGIQNDEIESSELLDITTNEESSAILLTMSIILQGNRSVGELTELLATISNDIEVDGILSDQSVLDNLRKSALSLDLTAIRKNLNERYLALGIEINVPPFEKYVNDFLDSTPEKPLVTTVEASDVHLNGATLNGIVQPNNSETSVLFEYGTTTEYTDSIYIEQNPLNGSVLQSVSANVAGLTPRTTYRFRIIADNDLGVTVGDDLIFVTGGGSPVVQTLDVTEIRPSSAILNGAVNANSLDTYVIFKYGTNTEYTDSISFDQNPVIGSTSQSVSANVTGLIPNTTYYYTVKATNELGIVYGEDKSFTTDDEIIALTTKLVSDITTTSAISGGSITDNGGTEITARGICWNTAGDPTLDDNVIVEGSGEGEYIAEMTDLVHYTDYYVRAFATNNVSTTFGDSRTFTTLDVPVDVSFDYSIDPNDYQRVTFENTSSDNAISYIWQFGDGQLSSEENPIHLYSLEGEFEVILSVYNKDTIESIISKTINIVNNDPLFDFKLLTGEISKEWILVREGTAIGVGPDVSNPEGWFSLKNSDATIRACLFEQIFTFSFDGTFGFEDNGVFWLEYGVFNGNDCYDNVQPESCIDINGPLLNSCNSDVSNWLSGTHSFLYEPTTGELTLQGLGAWIGLCNLGTTGTTIVPLEEVRTKITFERFIEYDVMTVIYNYSDSYYFARYAHYHDPTLKPPIEYP